MKTDPDNYFAEMSELNDQIRLIDANEAKTTKALAMAKKGNKFVDREL